MLTNRVRKEYILVHIDRVTVRATTIGGTDRVELIYCVEWVASKIDKGQQSHRTVDAAHELRAAYVDLRLNVPAILNCSDKALERLERGDPSVPDQCTLGGMFATLRDAINKRRNRHVHWKEYDVQDIVTDN